MRAIVIDPEAQTIQQVNWSGKTEDLFRLVGAEDIDHTTLPNGDEIWVDDAGLTSGQHRFGFKHEDYYHPLAGKGVIVGADRWGRSASSATTVSEARAKIRFVEFS